MKFTKCDHGIEKKGIEQFETVGKNGKYFCELRKKTNWTKMRQTCGKPISQFEMRLIFIV